MEDADGKMATDWKEIEEEHQNEEKEVTPKEKREGPEMIGEVSLEGHTSF